MGTEVPWKHHRYACLKWLCILTIR